MRPTSRWTLCVLASLAAMACSADQGVTSVKATSPPVASRVPSQPGTGFHYRSVSAGGSATCALTVWTVQCWGLVGEVLWGADPMAVSVGSVGTCMIAYPGQVFCGNGVPDPTESLFYEKVSVGAGYACGLTGHWTMPTDSLYCWGPRVPANPPTVSGYTDVSAGNDFACVVGPGGVISCWGNDQFGKATPPTPNGGYVQVTTGVWHACGLKANGRVKCWGENSFGRAAPPNLGNADFVQVSAGANHNCGLKKDTSILCWGDHTAAQSTPTNPNSGFSQVDAGGTVTCAVRSNDTLDCWGTDPYGSQFPAPSMFAFSGFFPPIMKTPAINPAIAGAPVVLRFSLGSDEGLGAVAAGWPKSRACPTTATPEPAVPTAGQLAYDAVSNTYIYIWDTEAGWAGTCRSFGLKFTDGTIASIAKFQF